MRSKIFLPLALKRGKVSSRSGSHNSSSMVKPFSMRKLGNMVRIQCLPCRFSDSSVYMRSRQFWIAIEDISNFEWKKFRIHTSTTTVCIFGSGWGPTDNSELKEIEFVARALLIGLQYESWGRPIPSERALSHTARTNPACTYPIWVSAGS